MSGASAPLDDAIPLAVSLGDQFTPAFSPDGRPVAFTWDGESQNNFNFYLKLVSSSSPTLRLTRNEDVDYSPAWLPDGSHVALCRTPEASITSRSLRGEWLQPSRRTHALGDRVQDVVASGIGQLALVHQSEDSNLGAVEVHGSATAPPKNSKLILATRRMEGSPSVRTDGKQVAFASNRS